LARNLQRTPHFNNLLGDLFFDAACFLIALLAALASLFARAQPIGDSAITFVVVAMEMTLFLTVFAYLFLIPVGWKLWLLLSNIQPETKPLDFE